MVRAGNLITNNLSNAYAAGAVSLRGETYVVSGIYRVIPAYTCALLREQAAGEKDAQGKHRKATTTCSPIHLREARG